MKRLALLLWVISATARAESSDGGEPFSWMKLGFGARQIGMGRAVVAMEGDAYALNGNPAGLVSLTRYSLATQTALLSQDRRLEHIALAKPMDFNFWRPGMGVSFSRFALESPIERRDTNTPEPVERWFQSSYAAQLGLASWIGDGSRTHSALGVTLRYVAENLGQASASGLGLDAGSLYRAKTWLNFGWAIDNLMSQNSWSGGITEASPRRLRLGAAAKFWDRRILISGELAKSEIQDARIRMGFECWVSPELLAFRVSLDHDRFGLGLGAIWDLSSSRLGLDYAVRSDPALPENFDHRFSLSYEFEP